METLPLAGVPISSPAPMADVDADYSFALEYDGPPLSYEIPRVIPIEIERIPVAALADPLPVAGLPVVHPLASVPGKKPPPRDAEPATASPTSVMDGLDADVGSSGALGSSGCPDPSTELSEVVDSSGAVGFSGDFNEMMIPDRLSSESALSSELDFRSSVASRNEYYVDETAVSQAKKASLVTFEESAQTSGSISSAADPFSSRELSEESELKIRRGACHRCMKGSRFTEKEACIVCDAKYCNGCVLRAMGSMPEGRKCVNCIGYPILESKRDKLGKSSRLLKKLLSSQEVQQAMNAEKNCEANQLRSEDICVNDKKLRPEEMVLLQTCPCPPKKLKPGHYWYDKVSGFWGKVGQKPDMIITPHLNIGGAIMRDASNGDTGILINGREITKVELHMLKWAGVECAGYPHFWVNADGTYMEEGQKKVKGQIWGKPLMKIVCPMLSLPIPTKFANSSSEEVNDMVNRAIPKYFEQRALQKFLLVGYHGSGTSTIFKQAKFLYSSNVPFSDEEREDIKLMIQSSIYSYLGILLEAREHFEEQSLAERRKEEVHSLGNVDLHESDGATEYSLGPRLKAFSDWLLEIMASGNLEAIFPAASREYAPRVEELWNDPAIQETYIRSRELQLLPDAASYFLERVIDISRVDYEPSDMDILYIDGVTSTNGLASTDFIFPSSASLGGSIDDADQQDVLLRYQLIRVHTRGLGDNCKWLDMFEDVRIVIFCISLNDYDVYYEDADGTVINKMMESKKLFERMVSDPILDQTGFLLVLNKFDLFEQKISITPLTSCEWFSDFNPVLSSNRSNNNNSRNITHGATPAQLAFYYIAVKFKRLFSSLTGRKLYVTSSNGLQSDSVDAALRYAREIVKWEEEKPVLGSMESIYSTEMTEPSFFSP